MIKFKNGFSVFRKRILPFVLVFALLLTGSLAYFTSNRFKKTKYNYGNVDTELWEIFDTNLDGNIAGYSNGSYNLDDINDEIYGPDDDHPTTTAFLLPNQTVIKAPWVKNTGNNSAYVYAEVGLPVQYTPVYDPTTGQKVSDGEAIEVFSIVNNNNEINKPNSGWSDLGIVEERDGFAYHLFSYNSPLEPNEETPHIFEYIQYANVGSTLPYEDFNSAGAFPSELIITDGDTSKGFKTIYGEVYANHLNDNSEEATNEILNSLWNRLYNVESLSDIEGTSAPLTHKTYDIFLYKASDSYLDMTDFSNAVMTFCDVDVDNNFSYYDVNLVSELGNLSVQDYAECFDENSNLLPSVASKTIYDNAAEAYAATGIAVASPILANAQNVVYSKLTYNDGSQNHTGVKASFELNGILHEAYFGDGVQEYIKNSVVSLSQADIPYFEYTNNDSEIYDLGNKIVLCPNDDMPGGVGYAVIVYDDSARADETISLSSNNLTGIEYSPEVYAWTYQGNDVVLNVLPNQSYFSGSLDAGIWASSDCLQYDGVNIHNNSSATINNKVYYHVSDSYSNTPSSLDFSLLLANPDYNSFIKNYSLELVALSASFLIGPISFPKFSSDFDILTFAGVKEISILNELSENENENENESGINKNLLMALAVSQAYKTFLSSYTIINIKKEVNFSDIKERINAEFDVNLSSIFNIGNHSNTLADANRDDLKLKPGVYFVFTPMQMFSSAIANLLASVVPFLLNDGNLQEQEFLSALQNLYVSFPFIFKTSESSILEEGYNIPINEYSIQTDGFENYDTLELYLNCFNKKRYSELEDDKAKEGVLTQNIDTPHNQNLFDSTHFSAFSDKVISVSEHEIDNYYLEEWLKNSKSCGYVKINDFPISKWDFLESLYIESNNVAYGPSFTWSNLTSLVNSGVWENDTEITHYDPRLVINENYMTFTPFVEETVNYYNDNTGNNGGIFNLPWIINATNTIEKYGESFSPGLYVFYYIDENDAVCSYGCKLEYCQKDTNFDEYDLLFDYDNIDNYELIDTDKYKIADIPEGINSVNDFIASAGYINNNVVSRDDWKQIQNLSSNNTYKDRNIVTFNNETPTYEENEVLQSRITFMVNADSSVTPLLDSEPANSAYDGDNAEVISADDIFLYNKSNHSYTFNGVPVENLLADAIMTLSLSYSDSHNINIFNGQNVIGSINDSEAPTAFEAAVNIIENNESILEYCPQSSRSFVVFNMDAQTVLTHVAPSDISVSVVPKNEWASSVVEEELNYFVSVFSSDMSTCYVYKNGISIKINYNTVLKRNPVSGNYILCKYNLNNNGLISEEAINKDDADYIIIDSVFMDCYKNSKNIVYEDSMGNQVILLRDSSLSNAVFGEITTSLVCYSPLTQLTDDWYGQIIHDDNLFANEIIQREFRDDTFSSINQVSPNKIGIYEDDSPPVSLLCSNIVLSKNNDDSFVLSIPGFDDIQITSEDASYSDANTVWINTQGTGNSRNIDSLILQEGMPGICTISPYLDVLLSKVISTDTTMLYGNSYKIEITPVINEGIVTSYQIGGYRSENSGEGVELVQLTTQEINNSSNLFAFINDYYNNIADYFDNDTAVFYCMPDFFHDFHLSCIPEEFFIINNIFNENESESEIYRIVSINEHQIKFWDGINENNAFYIFDEEPEVTPEDVPVLINHDLFAAAEDVLTYNNGNVEFMLFSVGENNYGYYFLSQYTKDFFISFMTALDNPLPENVVLSVYSDWEEYIESQIEEAYGSGFETTPSGRYWSMYMGRTLLMSYSDVISKNGDTYTIESFDLSSGNLVSTNIITPQSSNYADVDQTWNNALNEKTSHVFTDNGVSTIYLGENIVQFYHYGEEEDISDFLRSGDEIKGSISYTGEPSGIYFLSSGYVNDSDTKFYIKKNNSEGGN